MRQVGRDREIDSESLVRGDVGKGCRQNERKAATDNKSSEDWKNAIGKDRRNRIDQDD